jgi:hypothetical protein
MAYRPTRNQIFQTLPVLVSGQTLFTLSSPPFLAGQVKLRVNDVPYLQNEEFTVAGVNLTWLNPFDLTPDDEVVAEFVI